MPWGKSVLGRRYQQQQQPVEQLELKTVWEFFKLRFRTWKYAVKPKIYLHVGIGVDRNSQESELIPSSS